MPLKLTKKPAKTQVTETKVETSKDANGKLIKDKKGSVVKKETLVKDEAGSVETPAQGGSSQQAVVGYAVGSTHNTGDFNSVKFHVSIDIPCSPDEIEGVFDFARTWCEGKLNEVVSESLGGDE